MKNKLISGMLLLVMFLSVSLTEAPLVLAENDMIEISSAEDFVGFAEKCTLDTWSQNKTVNLICDIDFADCEFVPVPTFGGIFNGNGYTISGVNFTGTGSYVGIFRFIQESGMIKELNVRAAVLPEGSKSYIGGIAGENSGSIEQCSFDGMVKGQSVIGGISGNNADSGRIVYCTAYGNVNGEASVGGISGKNSGFIQYCTNNAAVNTMYEEKKQDITDIDTDPGAIIENYKNGEEEREEGFLGHSDCGGISGYSSGIIQGCTNNAAIGYSHVGYNVGGVAGRQSGYVLGCENYGFVQGRKDVGGIVGQLEPYILLDASENGLRDIRKELNKLNVMVNRFITDTDNLGDDTERYLTDILDYTKKASDSAENMINQGTDFVDDNLDEINATTAILSDTVDKLIPVFDDLEKSGDDLEGALDGIAEVLEETKLYAPEIGEDIDKTVNALTEISNAGKQIKKSISRMNRAGRNLEEAIVFKKESEVKKAVSEISEAIKDIIIAKQAVKNAVGRIEEILNTKPDSFESIGINAKEIAENLKNINTNINASISAFKKIKNGLDIVILNTTIDFSEFKSAAENIRYAMVYLAESMDDLSGGLKNLGTAIEGMSDELQDYTDDMNEKLNNAADDLGDCFKKLSYTMDDIKEATKKLKNITEELAEEETPEFVKLGEDFKTANTDLFDSLSEISDSVESLKNIVSDEKNILTNDLTSVSNQFKLIMNLLIDEIDSLKDGYKSLEDIFVDVSDEAIEKTKQGKLEECRNFGRVEADRNTGGIAGVMAVEYSKDPEDDIEKPDTFNFIYRTKAILQACVNDGTVVGKKDCTGGIAGSTEIGMIYECQNYADIESTGGNYIGGIVGKSEAAVRRSYAKSLLNGKRYIGGIAGKGSRIEACGAIVNIQGDENKGAICGTVEDIDKLYKNFYVDNGIGAVDGISYSGKAEAVAFEELCEKNGLPQRFISFKVTFVADDEIVDEQEIKYGEPTDRIEYPEIPQKEGMFGKWETVEAEAVKENIKIHCEYKPYVTVIASEERDENGRLALALAEGSFTDEAELHVEKSEEKAPESIKGETKIYDISMINTDIGENDNVTLRMLRGENKISIWVLNDAGKWEKIKTKSKGRYEILQLKGTKNTVCLKYEGRRVTFIWGILAVIAVCLALIFIVKRKHKKKS